MFVTAVGVDPPQAAQDVRPLLGPAIDGLALKAQQYTGPFRQKLLGAMDLFSDPMKPGQRWSVNNVEYLTWNDPAPLAGQGHDHFGFNEWEARVCFDNVKVTPL